jgi:hypothetical protein
VAPATIERDGAFAEAIDTLEQEVRKDLRLAVALQGRLDGIAQHGERTPEGVDLRSQGPRRQVHVSVVTVILVALMATAHPCGGGVYGFAT